MSCELLGYDEKGAERAGRLLSEGLPGIFPSDTVYSLSAAADKAGEDILYRIKRRPESKRFIALMTIDDLLASGLIVPERLLSLWPAPFTAILKDKEGMTQAVRIPSDGFVQRILSISGPIWSSSVNISGQPAMGDPDRIAETFSEDVAFIIKGPVLENGTPSTLIDATADDWRIIRQGSYIIPTA